MPKPRVHERLGSCTSCDSFQTPLPNSKPVLSPCARASVSACSRDQQPCTNARMDHMVHTQMLLSTSLSARFGNTGLEPLHFDGMKGHCV